MCVDFEKFTSVNEERYHPIKNLRSVLGVSLENYFPPGFFHGFVTRIFPWTTYRLPTIELQYIMCGSLWASVIYSVSLLEYRSLSAGRYWRISRECGGLSRRNAMDSTRDSSVVSPCPTQGPLFSHGQCAPKFFDWAIPLSFLDQNARLGLVDNINLTTLYLYSNTTDPQKLQKNKQSNVFRYNQTFFVRDIFIQS